MSAINKFTRKKIIAYAEEDFMWNMTIRDFLQLKDNYVVISSESCQNMLAQAEEIGISPGIFIIDLYGPIEENLIALKYIKLRWPEAKVIVLTGKPSSLYGKLAVEAGANAYLEKGKDFLMLHQAVDDVWEQGYSCIGFSQSDLRALSAEVEL